MKLTQKKNLPAIDPTIWSEFLSLDSDGGALITELIAVFLHDTEQTIQNIQSAADGGNSTALKKSAHRLKSSAAGLGALDLAQLLGELENSPDTGHSETGTRISRIRAEFARVREFLETAVPVRKAS